MVFPKYIPFWILKFHSVGELSCQGCVLEIEYQIAYPSVTGKVQNLQKKMNVWAILACIVHTVSELKMFACWRAGQKAH